MAQEARSDESLDIPVLESTAAWYELQAQAMLAKARELRERADYLKKHEMG